MERDHQIVFRGRLGIIPRERCIYEALAHDGKNSRKQVAIYIGRLIVEIGPALETSFGVIRDGAVSMADTIIILIPRRDLVIRQEAVLGLAFRLDPSR